MVLFFGGPLDGRVLPVESRTVVAEEPQPLFGEDPAVPMPLIDDGMRPLVLYDVRRFGRSAEQWIWIAFTGLRGPAVAEVWAALTRPGVRAALAASPPPDSPPPRRSLGRQAAPASASSALPPRQHQGGEGRGSVN